MVTMSPLPPTEALKRQIAEPSAAAAGKPVFSFDHRTLAERVYAPYGKDLILRNREDIVRVFREAQNGFRGLDCQWEQLGRDFSRYADGRCIQRYRQMILDAVEQAAG